MTSLESLANELLLDLFEYLSTVHLLNAFHGINRRFTTVLGMYFYTHYLDFRLVSKDNCKIICEQHLPSIIDRIVSLRLSDNEDNSLKQTDFFLSYGFKLNQFIHLRSLSLDHIYSEQTMNHMIFRCYCLSHLSHLRLVKCCFVSEYIFNTIWRLPKLTHCYLDIEQNDFHMPTMVSLSLKYLLILGYCCHLKQLAGLFEQTPRLQSLCIQLNDVKDDERLPSPASLITTLKLYHVRSRHVMMDLLQNMSNLSHLRVETSDIDLNGYQWKEIIMSYLPKLTVFRLKMEMQFPRKINDEQQIDNLLDSFRSEFWLSTHQWFVRCHWKLMKDHIKVLLYTLPQTFVKFDMSTMNIAYESTCPYDNVQCSYRRVHSITYHPFSNRNSFSSHVGFFSIRHLSVNLPLDEQFWKIIPSLDTLTSLCVSSSDDDAQNHLQNVLDRSPSLYTLAIKSWPSSQISLARNTNRSVRRLDLRLLELSDQHGSNPSLIIHKCVELGIFSPGISWQVLLIDTVHVEYIFALLKTMTNLRVLNVTWPSHKSTSPTYNSESFEIYNFIKRLQYRCTFTNMIINYIPGKYNIQLRIDRDIF